MGRLLGTPRGEVRVSDARMPDAANLSSIPLRSGVRPKSVESPFLWSARHGDRGGPRRLSVPLRRQLRVPAAFGGHVPAEPPLRSAATPAPHNNLHPISTNRGTFRVTRPFFSCPRAGPAYHSRMVALSTHYAPLSTDEARLLDALCHPEASIAQIAREHGVTVADLTLWMARPDIANQLDALESACATRARLIAGLSPPGRRRPRAPRVRVQPRGRQPPRAEPRVRPPRLLPPPPHRQLHPRACHYPLTNKHP